MKSDNVTVTQGRMKQAFSNSIGQIVKNETTKIVKEAIDDSKISAGVVTKFYPHLDKAEVQISNSNKKVLCKILHRFGGELIDFYTPNGDLIFDEEMKEKCIIPRGDLNCLVVDINSFDDEYLLLGYYNIDELIGINPASQGNLKICTEGGTNEFFIKFGYDGLELRLPDSISTIIGEMDEDMVETDYASSSHTHGTWNSITITNGILYYNSAIRMCALRYSRTFSSASANTMYEWWQLIPSTYRPKYMVSGSGNRNGATITIDSDGYVYGRFAIAFTSSTSFYYHVMWHY